MHAVYGNKTKEVTKKDYLTLISKYKGVHVDIGTGDGRYVYTAAKNDKNTLYVGLDPSEKQLRIYSKKAQKDKVLNTLFVIGSIDVFPTELFDTVTSISIYFPWGSLLATIVTLPDSFLALIKNICSKKRSTKIDIVFGYSSEAEPSETKRLTLEDIDLDYIYKNSVPKLILNNFNIACIKILDKAELKNIASTWGKKLTFGRDRPVFSVSFVYLKA